MERERLYGLKEIATSLGERPATLSAWLARGTNAMPPPDARLAAGPVWFASTVEPWMAMHSADPLPAAPAVRAVVLRRILRRHLRTTALLLEDRPLRPGLIAQSLKDLEDAGPDCARAASEAEGPLARALAAERDLIARLGSVRRATERELAPSGDRRRPRWVGPELDRDFAALGRAFGLQAAALTAAVTAWLAEHPDGGPKGHPRT